MPVYQNGIDTIKLWQTIIDKLVERNLLSKEDVKEILYSCASPELQAMMKGEKPNTFDGGITFQA